MSGRYLPGVTTVGAEKSPQFNVNCNGPPDT